jgi:hypothetical protein
MAEKNVIFWVAIALIFLVVAWVIVVIVADMTTQNYSKDACIAVYTRWLPIMGKLIGSFRCAGVPT